MNTIRIIILTTAIINLASCGSNPTKKQGGYPNEVFVTNINSNHIKIFNYSLISKIPKQGQMRKGKGGGKRGGMGGGMKKGSEPDFKKKKLKMEEKAYKKLNLKLIETGYCREGYIELDSFFERGHVTIKGECNEGATQGDRDKFINFSD